MKRYVIYKYLSGSERVVLFQSNSIEETVKSWEKLSNDPVGIGWCKELGYLMLGASGRSKDEKYLEIQTPEYYNTNQFKLS